MKNLTDTDVTDLADELGTTESEIRRVEAEVNASFDINKVGTAGEEGGLTEAHFRGEQRRTGLGG